MIQYYLINLVSQIVSAFATGSTFHQLPCPFDIPPLLCEGVGGYFANFFTFWYWEMLQDHLVYVLSYS